MDALKKKEIFTCLLFTRPFLLIIVFILQFKSTL